MATPQSTDDYKRYCPGEESVKISTAVCRGRRRAHFPKCHGCQFNDDEQTARVVATLPVRAPREVADSARVVNGQVVEAKRSDSKIGSMFRVSDIAGSVPDPLSDEAAWRIGHATAQFLRAKLRGYDRADPDANSVFIGRDTRPDSLRIEQALVEGIRATGTDVIMLGLIDTPQLYFAVEQTRACGGVMVSAGHQPIGENGFRICGANALPIGIETGLGSIRDIAVRVPKHVTGANSRRLERDLSEAYIEFMRKPLAAKTRLPRPLRVVVDASNGVAGKWFPILFRGIRNLRVTKLNFETDGNFAHEPNPLRSRCLQDLRQAVRDESADFGICFDAAAERCLFIDDKGRTVRPEFIIALLARHMLNTNPGAVIVFDHRASTVTEEEIIQSGGTAIRERIGAAYIKRAMSENDAIFGGDLSGRLFFRESANCESALLAFVHVVDLLMSDDHKLSDLVKPLQRYSTSGEMCYRCENTERVLGNLEAALPKARVERFDGVTFRFPDWWFNIRPNAAEGTLKLNIEARSRKNIDEKLIVLEPFLGDLM
ncbi:MAG: hypothetical protein H6819_00285 [Phycisphaerales bacterium]|nr:hypothetical protein [Phycisphaerales bacterium]MCB9857354.1 hypothetical protein [Phycisphaerales bacterium]